MNEECVAEASVLEGAPQLREFLGGIDEPDLALALELQHVVGFTIRRLGHDGEGKRGLGGGPRLVLDIGKGHGYRARRADARALAGAREFRFVRQPFHHLRIGERERVVAREGPRIACHEGRENVVVRHENELLVGMLTRNAHQHVQQLRVAGMSTDMANIEEV